MRKQCVPGSFFSTHAQEPRNEANFHLDCKGCMIAVSSYWYYTPISFKFGTVLGGSKLRLATKHMTSSLFPFLAFRIVSIMKLKDFPFHPHS